MTNEMEDGGEWEAPAREEALLHGELLTETTSEERTLAAVAHASGVVSSTLLPLLVPLVIYFLKKDESRFVASQAKEALNFQITIFLAVVLCLFLMIIVIGAFLLPVVGLASLIFSIVAAIKTYEGKPYRYPIAIRFF